MTQHIATQPTVSTTIDARNENFVQAYIDIGYHPEDAAELGALRLQQDDAALFTIEACTDFVSAKEVVYLLEAVTLLCSGNMEDAEVLRLLDRARYGIRSRQ